MPPAALYFRFFNEIGIIHQLATTILETHLPDGLLAPHFAVLNHLARLHDGPADAGRTPLAMARAFQTPKTTMTHQVGVLARHGLVTLAPNPEDGRSKLVRLTPAGHGLRGRIIAEVGALAEGWSEAFDPYEIAAAIPVLERIRIHLDAERET